MIIINGTLEALSEQAIAGVIAQGAPAADGRACKYITTGERGEQLRCAIGHMLTVEQATELEDYLTHSDDEQPSGFILSLIEQEVISFPEVTDKNALSALQDVHDSLMVRSGQTGGVYSPFLDHFIKDSDQWREDFITNPQP